MSEFLEASVGEGGSNRAEDIRTVQRLLGQRGYWTGTPTGICDSETIDAIRRFQAQFMTHPDGRVDTHATTWRRLNAADNTTAHDATDDTQGNGVQRHPIAGIDTHAITRWVTRDGNEVFFESLEGHPQHREWTHRSRQRRIPADAHEVRVLSPYRSPLVPGGFNRMTRQRVLFLNAIRRAIQSAGLNWDPRVLMPLWANESNWDRSNFGYNVGNIKAQGTVYARSFAQLVETRTVWVVVPESTGVMVFGDRVSSIDGYHAFANATAYCQYAARRFASFPGALAALQRGGEEGAADFARALQGGARRYSPAAVEEALKMFVGSYRKSRRLIGEENYQR